METVVEHSQELSKPRGKNVSPSSSKTSIQEFREPIIDVVKYPERMTLDVGCGDNPQGTVNCDINVGKVLEGGDQKQGIFIEPKKIKNFVKCDAHHLPFRSDCFREVDCFHLIEHVEHPLKLLKELIRVSSDCVTIKCPHRFSRGAKLPFHVRYLNLFWFERTLCRLRDSSHKKFTFSVSLSYVPWFSFFGLVRPGEITVRIGECRREVD